MEDHQQQHTTQSVDIQAEDNDIVPVNTQEVSSIYHYQNCHLSIYRISS